MARTKIRPRVIVGACLWRFKTNGFLGGGWSQDDCPAHSHDHREVQDIRGHPQWEIDQAVEQDCRDSCQTSCPQTTRHRIVLSKASRYHTGEVDNESRSDQCGVYHATFGKHFQKLIMAMIQGRSEEHTSELQSRLHLVCRLLLEKKKKK